MYKFVAFAVAATVAAAPVSAQTVITTLSSPVPAGESWGTLPGENTGTAAITTTAPRDGTGSLELTGDRTRVQTGIQYNVPGVGPTSITSLDNVQSLTFDWQIATDSMRLDYSPALRLLVQDGTQRSELIWEAAYQNMTGTDIAATAGTWQTSAADALFWQFVAGSGANETGPNGSLVLMTLAQWAASGFYTNDAYVSGLSVGAGSSAGVGYHAFVDNVVFTTTEGSRSYNFEAAAAVPEPGTWAMMLIGFGAIGYSMRKARRATPVPSAA